MAIKLKALDELMDTSKALENPALIEWKKQGGKVVGFFYDYIPEELFTAAGILPYRVRATGSTGAELAGAYFTDINCTYVRHCFNEALQKKMQFLDGVVVHNFCDHMRRIYDNWKVALQPSFIHFVVLPKKRGEEQVEAYLEQLVSLKNALEQHFGVAITDERLRDAIRVHNETRRLQRELYELRKSDNPPLTGAETLGVMVAGTAMPREKYNQLLKELLTELKQATPRYAKPKVRLMLVAGGAIDDPSYVEVLESQGGMVVTDASSFGTKAMWVDVQNTGNPLTDLAQYQIIDRPACMRFCLTEPERNAFVKDRVDEFKVDGVVTVSTKFCDLWDFEQLMLSRYLEDRNVQHLDLQSEYLLSGVSQLKTRVQAFVETLRG